MDLLIAFLMGCQTGPIEVNTTHILLNRVKYFLMAYHSKAILVSSSNGKATSNVVL
jgi:hypothetical protein